MPANQSNFQVRHQKLYSALAENSLDAMLLNPGPSLTYLTGLRFHLMERPVVAVFIPGHTPILVLPELEQAKLEHLPFQVQAVPYGEDPAAWPQAFAQAARLAGLTTGDKVGVEPIRMRLLEMRYMEQALPGADFPAADEVVSALRICKDKAEIAAMRTAVEIAQTALERTLPVVRAGVSEREIAAELTLQLLRAGSDSEFPFTPIVSGGPNSANPHASPSDRRLQPGDLLVIDWGAIYNGYISDLTRTFAIGHVDPEYTRIHEITLSANQAGRAAAKPGIPAQVVDQAARTVIDQAGYGAYFIHRTGHGIGMEGHEPPYMRQGNLQILEPGMAFTVEPGIYLNGRNGVRIEDNVIITQDGAETLSSMDRSLRTIEA